MVGTAHTGNPSCSSAKTTLRFPTDPRTTWLDMTIIGEWRSECALFIASAGINCEIDQPPDQIDEQYHSRPAADTGAPQFGPVALVGIIPCHVMARAPQHGRLALQINAIDDAPRFVSGLVVPVHFDLPNKTSD